MWYEFQIYDKICLRWNVELGVRMDDVEGRGHGKDPSFYNFYLAPMAYNRCDLFIPVAQSPKIGVICDKYGLFYESPLFKYSLAHNK